MIRIMSKRAGFRRCGIEHPAVPVEYPDDRFTKNELAALTADPMLKVEFLDDPEPDAGDDGSEGSTPPQVSGLSPQPSETPQPSKRKGRKG